MTQESMLQSTILRSRPVSFVRDLLARVNIKHVKLVQFQRSLGDLDRSIVEQVTSRTVMIGLKDISDPVILDALIPKGIIRNCKKRMWKKSYDKEHDSLRMEIIKKFEEGDICLLQYDGDSPSGYIWFSYGKKKLEPSIEQYIVPESDQAIIHSLNIDPAHRHKGLARQIILHSLLYLSNNTECGSVMVFIEKNNLRSQMAFRANGFKPVRQYSFLRLLNYTRLTVTDL